MPGLPASLAPASVHFAYPGSRSAIPLRDVRTDALLGEWPEWIAASREEPAAFVRGARPTVRVVFSGGPAAAGTTLAATVGARGSACPGLAPRRVRLTFDANGLSAPVALRFDAPLPDRIGAHRITWSWFAQAPTGEIGIGPSTHEVFTTWRAPRDPAAWLPRTEVQAEPKRPARHWTYKPIIEWTSTWAAGLDDAKAICDTILAKLPASGLRYAISAHDVRAILQKGGGMCGGLYKLFQALAGAQGVAVERRSYLVNWRRERNGDDCWCAIVVDSGGLGRQSPEVPRWVFHDCTTRPMRNARVRRARARRYAFFGMPGPRGEPGVPADGHCVNFLRYRGVWYLYDASFASRPVRLDRFRLPAPDLARARTAGAADPFRQSYLDHAVDFMLGSATVRGRYYRTTVPGENAPKKLPRIIPGLTVRTAIVPPGRRAITFFWGP